jgi:hypothetical protein
MSPNAYWTCQRTKAAKEQNLRTKAAKEQKQLEQSGRAKLVNKNMGTPCNKVSLLQMTTHGVWDLR